jgi:hypothetical protein
MVPTVTAVVMVTAVTVVLLQLLAVVQDEATLN